MTAEIENINLIKVARMVRDKARELGDEVTAKQPLTTIAKEIDLTMKRKGYIRKDGK